MERRILEADEIGAQTLVGFLPPKRYPAEHGNCFGIRAENGNYYQIVNFCVENFEVLLKRGLKLPVKIMVLSSNELKHNRGIAIIYDERIPRNWYFNKWCEICCPEEFLPEPQKIQHQLAEMRGDRKIIKYKDDYGFEQIMIAESFGKGPDFRTEEEKKEDAQPLKTKWSNTLNSGSVYAPYIPVFDMRPSSSLIEKYSKKMINPDYFSEIEIKPDDDKKE